MPTILDKRWTHGTIAIVMNILMHQLTRHFLDIAQDIDIYHTIKRHINNINKQIDSPPILQPAPSPESNVDSPVPILEEALIPRQTLILDSTDSKSKRRKVAPEK